MPTPVFPAMTAVATAPASSANLGPGFDTLALALDIRCRVTAQPADRWCIEHVGDERPTSGEDDLVLTAARHTAGTERPLALVVENGIPMGRGLGSSAAAATAAAAAAASVAGIHMGHDALLPLVASLEGHPDNAAAAVYGGLVAVGPGGTVARLELHPSLRPLLAVPDHGLPTTRARAALPETVSRAVAARSVARTVMLVEGLRLADRALLEEASGDELHERPRRHLHPEAEVLIAAAKRAGALHACWSGAGPAVLALVDRAETERVAEVMSRMLGGAGRVLTPPVAPVGVEVVH
ncbi:MAG TPA: homoserine kinase [Acidimicrobiia bacterium]|nr:homoserine kinase [Acidimicrobiia bacterium]